jgi:hypothetical protein
MKHLFAILLFCVLVPCAYADTYVVQFPDTSKEQFRSIRQALKESFVAERKGVSTAKRELRYAFNGDIDDFVDELEESLDEASFSVGDMDYDASTVIVEIEKYPDGQQTTSVASSSTVSETLYRQPIQKFVEGDKKWFSDGDETIHVKYVGETKDGVPHGIGTETVSFNPHKGQKYVGEWKEGKKHGQGTYTWASGDKYVGEWRDGKWFDPKDTQCLTEKEQLNRLAKIKADCAKTVDPNKHIAITPECSDEVRNQFWEFGLSQGMIPTPWNDGIQLKQRVEFAPLRQPTAQKCSYCAQVIAYEESNKEYIVQFDRWVSRKLDTRNKINRCLNYIETLENCGKITGFTKNFVSHASNNLSVPEFALKFWGVKSYPEGGIWLGSLATFWVGGGSCDLFLKVTEEKIFYCSVRRVINYQDEWLATDVGDCEKWDERSPIPVYDVSGN